ncbi:MAG: tetratricopeptide repeat protein [Bacteroidetes bacterium]|nr:tetratricopeptide repeat protein [Bacteroidota bacterium]
MDTPDPFFQAFTPDSSKGSRSPGKPGNASYSIRKAPKTEAAEENTEQAVQRAERWLATGDWTRAWEASDLAVRLATANSIKCREDQCLQARSYDALGQALFGLGKWSDSQTALERAIAAWETLERGRDLARALQSLAQLHLSIGKMDHALGLLCQAAHVWEREGCMAEAGLTWLELATCLADLGETNAAKRHLRQGLHQVEASGAISDQIRARRLAVTACALLGDGEARIEQLEALCRLQEAYIGKIGTEGATTDSASVDSDQPGPSKAAAAPSDHPDQKTSSDAGYYEAIRTFTGKAAHDMKEPLRMIGSFSALLRRQYGTLLDAEGHEYLDIVLDANDRMSELLKKLLDLTRLGSTGKSFAEVDLADVAFIAAHRLRSEVEQRQALIETQAMPVICGQREELELLVFHLLDNALKFNRSKRAHIVLHAEQENGAIILTVQDNGIGIDPNSRDEVFDLFRRLHPRTEYRGSGIGLSIVARVAALHGGTCWIENGRLGGCAVCVRLPVQQPQS